MLKGAAGQVGFLEEFQPILGFPNKTASGRSSGSVHGYTSL